MLAQGILRVKGQAKITKYYFLWVGAINMQSLSGHYFMPHFTPHGVFTSFSLSRCYCLHFCKNKFGLMLAQGYFKGQRSSIMHKLQLLMTLCDMQSSSGNYSMCHQVPLVSLLLSWSKCCCLHICRNKFGLLLAQGYFKGQRSRINHKLQLFMISCDMQSSSGKYSMRHQVLMVFLLLLVYWSAVTCISEERNLGPCWRAKIF